MRSYHFLCLLGLVTLVGYSPALQAQPVSAVPSSRAVDAPAAGPVLAPLAQIDSAALTTRQVEIQRDQAAGLLQAKVAPTMEKLPPQITLTAPAEGWDWSAHQSIQMPVTNTGAVPLILLCEAHTPQSNDKYDHTAWGIVRLQPGETKPLRVHLIRSPKDPGFAYFQNGKFFKFIRSMHPYRGNLDPKQITKLVWTVDLPMAGTQFTLGEVRGVGQGAAAPVEFFPWIDEFGQYKHMWWESKIESEDHFQARAQAELEALKGDTRVTEWNRFGGWASGPKFTATGSFYPIKHEGKWWLVDPEGCLFFSHGIDGVRTFNPTIVTGLEKWYEKLPDRKDPLYGSCFYPWKIPARWGKEGVEYVYFEFLRANVIRKYGPDWQMTHAQVAHQRLQAWGVNTLANWSERHICLLSKTPYIMPLDVSWGAKLRTTWPSFPDPFDATYEKNLRAMLEKEKETTAQDPMCIGYFIDNEIGWGKPQDRVNFGKTALNSAADFPAKKVLLDRLQAKYQDVAALNQAWGTTFESWEVLLEKKHALPKTINPAATADLEDFYRLVADTYFGTNRRVLKEYAPSKLYLGSRMAPYCGFNDDAFAAAAKHTDVIGVNFYDGTLDKFTIKPDKPVIIGEFSNTYFAASPFNNPDPRPASRRAASEKYRTYLLSALRHPLIVGTGYFVHNDQPASGRWDGEAIIRGVVDVSDTPRKEFTDVLRSVGEHMYEYRATGKAEGILPAAAPAVEPNP